ncbi:MAG: hypothetical protein HYU36_07615 [Planctomycetes bacterium]|nr:hypothetical protein [Planctomycetota bacterium]
MLAGQAVGGIWANFDGNVDNFTIVLDNSCTTYDFECSAPPGPIAVTISSVSPAVLGVPEDTAAEEDLTVTITGSGFNSLTLPISVSLGAGISVSNMARVSDTEIRVSARVGAAAKGGASDVSVANVTATGLFSKVNVTSGSPGILGVPETTADEKNVSVRIQGAGFDAFQGDVTVSLGEGIAVSQAQIVNDAMITVQAKVRAGVSGGTRVLKITETGVPEITRRTYFKVLKVTAARTLLCVDDAAGASIGLTLQPQVTGAPLVYGSSSAKALPEGTVVSPSGVLSGGPNPGSGDVEVKIESVVAARANVDVFRVTFTAAEQEICQTVKLNGDTSPGTAGIQVLIDPADLATDVFFASTSLDPAVNPGNVATFTPVRATNSPEGILVTAADPATNANATGGAIKIDARLGSASGSVCGSGAIVSVIDGYEILPQTVFLLQGETFERVHEFTSAPALADSCTRGTHASP